MVKPELDQKIDIVESETACAYEFKVSGKNAWAEFYKDVVKVLMWNQHREKKLSCLTFITEEKYGKPQTSDGYGVETHDFGREIFGDSGPKAVRRFCDACCQAWALRHDKSAHNLFCFQRIDILPPRNRGDRLLAQPGGATFRSTGTHQIALADRL